MKIRPARFLRGTINLPGDKSISHRAAMIAAMAAGDTRIKNFSTAEDCQTTLKCLKELGVDISQDGTTVIVKGVGKTGFKKPANLLDCGNSGTTMRLLAGILAGQEFDSVLTGDESLSRRPMNRIIEPLTEMGARIESRDGCLPLHIFGGQTLRGIEFELPIASAQVGSCLLFAGLSAEGKTTVVQRTRTRDHTERMLKWFGVNVDTHLQSAGNHTCLTGDAVLTARDIDVPCDISSAAFFMVAAACLKASDIFIPDVGLNPTRTMILNALQIVGVDVQTSTSTEISNEPRASIRVRGGLAPDSSENRLKAYDSTVARLLDEIPILAVLGTQFDGGIEIRNASELRVKESDRISAIVENLRRMKAGVAEFHDGFRVKKSHLKGASIDPLGDHRIAMAFAIAGLLAEGETEIVNAECVDISFPGFFEVLNSVVD